MAIDPVTGVFEYEESTAVGTTFSGYLNKGMTPIKTAIASILTTGKIGDSGWINLTLVNSWAVTLGETPQYRKLNGIVYLRGLITGGSATTVATLPVGFRPASIIRNVVKAATSPTTTTSLQIDPTGVITSPTGASPNLGPCAPYPADN